MGKKINLRLFSLACILFVANNSSFAQPTCSCTHPVPLFPTANACNAVQKTISGPGKVCGTTAACAANTTNYIPAGFSSTELKSLTGYMWRITGGGGTSCASGVPLDSGGGRSQNGFTSDTLMPAKINWSTAGTDILEFYGYVGWTGGSGGNPTGLGFYACIQVTVATASAPPPAPTSIFMSSAVCYPPPKLDGWMYESSPCSPSATSWTWTGSGSGVFYICNQGPVLTAGQWNNQAYLCVTQNNTCGSSAPYCAYVNVPSTAQPPCPKTNSLPQTGQLMRVNADDFSAERAVPAFETYPNPATGMLTVNLPGSGTYNIQMITGQGKVVKNVIARNTTSKTVAITDLPAGLYFIIIKENGLPVSQKKVLIQR